MLRLALIGKDITHSRSPEIYKRLISPDITYDLLDYENTAEIPELTVLAQKYDGINITSPYKEYFIGKSELTENAKRLGAINCLKFSNGNVFGENTDFLAIVDILKKYLKQDPEISVCILGDGVMSRVTQRALEQLNTAFKVKSRKISDDFSRLDLSDFNLIINTCARQYVFNGVLSAEATFWDYNYAHTDQKDAIQKLNSHYVDGLKLLELQAQYAKAFWSIK